ncbi:MAG: GDYXXLXY domain-containing protein [Robiginitomaculum sp.]|nr:GDYXXLXY domain-containing protein [Robiginitomaculum sp.]
MIRIAALLGLCAVLTAFLLSMIWGHQQARNNGTEIILDMEPVDPRSLFRGHYVIIKTPLHEIHPSSVLGDDDFNKGDKIFVSLTRDENENFNITSITKQQPAEGSIFIQGRVWSYWKIVQGFAEQPNNRIKIQYNIESYFTDKVSALALEKKVEESKMRIILSVDENGKAVIRGLEIDGTRFIDEL